MEQLRQTGIGVVDHMEWGTHFCHFYETKTDLLDTLVPYLKAGLDNNELCIWVVAQPLTSAEAIKAIRAAVPAIDLHLSNRDLMIVSYPDWYLRDGSFNLQRVLNSWQQEVAKALARGYAGVRVTGDVVWEDQNGWRNFAEYERAVDDAISDLRMTALCTYALGNCGASHVLDVLSSHQFALATRNGELEVVENSETKKTNAEFQRLNRELEGRVIERTGELEQRIVERKQAEVRSAAFATLARKLSGASVPLDAAKIIVDTADQLFGWDSCTINLYDSDRDVLQPVLGIDTFDGRRANVASLAKERKPTPRIRRLIEQSSGLTLREEPCAFDEDSVPFGDKTRPSASIMDVLIRHASEIIGTLSLQSYTPRSYDQHALNNLQALADHCGEALNRIRAEQALRESEERYRDLIESSQDVFCTHDLDGRLLSANRATEKLLNYEAKEFAGKNLRELVAPAVRDQFDDYLARIRRDGIVSGSTLVLTSKGERRVWEFYNTLRTEGVAAPIIRCTARDITERKRAEESLKVFRNLIDQSNDAIEVIDAHTFRFLDCNQSAYQSLGYTREEFLQLTVFDIDPLVDSGTIARQNDEIGKSGFATVESIHLRKDGTAFPVEINVKVVRLERDYRLAVVRDITERKRAEESLGKQNEYLAALHETALGLINRLDLNELLEVIVTRALALVDIPGGHVYLVEPGGTEMSVKVGVGVSRDFVGARIRKGEGVAGKIWETGQPLVVNDYRNWEHRLTDPGYDALRLVGAVPLISGSQVIGVLGVESTEDGQGLDKNQIEILNRFAQLASIALDNAQLHSAVQQELAERKRSEEEVSNLRRDLELTMNSMEEGIHRVDMHGNIAFENPAAARMLGWEVAELLGKPAHLTMHHTKPDGTPYPKEECPIYATVRDGVSRRGADEVFCRRDGTSFPVEYMTAPMRNDRDEIVATVVTFRDITDRKRAEEVLREREARLSAIYRAAPVGIGVDVNRVIQEVNDTLCRITGYSREELIGQNSRFLFITQEEYERVGREKYRVTAEHLSRSITARLRRKDGRVIDVLLNAVLLDAADLGQGVTFTVQDITEPRQVEEALREAEQKYRELFENAKDAIYVHDLTGRYTSVNPAAEALSGYPHDEILGKHFTDFIAPEYLGPAQDSLCRKLRESGETSYEAEVITSDGRRVPVEINSRLIRRNGRVVGVQGAVRDITERKRAQEAMRSYSHRLIEAQEAERQSIARELHDEIGQVLTAVRINLQSAQRSSGTEAYLLRIEDSIVVVDEALNRVRELSLQLRPSLLDDLGLTAALRWYADRYARRTGFTVQILSDCETGRLRRELETACFRIAQEALTNVARYTEATHILVELKRANDTLSLVIKDDGPGFDVAALLRNAPTGAVLGLRGMEERALAVEGRFEINSAPGQGTEVRATFPLTRKG